MRRPRFSGESGGALSSAASRAGLSGETKIPCFAGSRDKDVATTFFGPSLIARTRQSACENTDRRPVIFLSAPVCTFPPPFASRKRGRWIARHRPREKEGAFGG